MNDVISEIPLDLQLNLAKLLDRKKEPNWKTFVAKTPTDVYCFKKGEFESLRLAILKPGGSPTMKLIEKLGSKKVQVCHFIDILERLPVDENIHKALDLFMGEPPLILLQPPPEVQLKVGDDLEILCDGTGRQPLSYQWFKESTVMETQRDRRLVMESVQPENEGMYICRVSNIRGYQFSRWVRIVVEKSKSGQEKELKMEEPSSPTQPLVHPKSVTLSHGSLLSLFCDGGASPTQSFQWLKDEQEIPGATYCELVISPVCEDHEGTYTCRVLNDSGAVQSRSANVQITKGQLLKKNIQEDVNEVSDKVALLIGNKDYDHSEKLGKLYHPTNDVRDIAGVLQSIGFKVISLINLTLGEMRHALRLFAQLLDRGVYALFYFAGHGFEANRKSYLMPVDASEKYECAENLSANEVLHVMQEREARLKVLLLDCCRTTHSFPHFHTSEVKTCDGLRDASYRVRSVHRPINQGKLDFHDPISSGGLNAEQENVVIAFGCCSQGRVFEHGSRRNGYFAIHLLEHLGDHEKNVEQVLLHAAKGVREEQIFDSYTGHIQMVFRYSSLAEHWCLCDEIVPNEKRSLQALHWQKAHELPRSPVTIYEKDLVEVILRFNAEFSNVLFVRASIDTEDSGIILEPLKFLLPGNKSVNGCHIEEISADDDESIPEKFTDEETAVKITDLQRLKGPLSLSLKVCYIRNDNKLLTEIVNYEFHEKPLYARLT